MKNKKIKIKGGFIHRTHSKQICRKCRKLVSKVYPDKKTHEFLCPNCIAEREVINAEYKLKF